MAYTEPPNYEQDPENAGGDDAGDGEQIVQLKRGQIRNMEKDAKAKRQAVQEAQEAAAERDAAKRELAFLKANVPVTSDDPKVKKVAELFSKSYDGELEPEAIKAAWAELNGETPPESQVSDADKQAAEEREALASGEGDTGQAPPVDAKKAARDAAERVLEEGATRDDAMATQIASLAEAASNGDQSVLIEQ